MDQQILQAEKAAERKEILKNSCARTEELTYSKKYTPDELILKKDELTQQDIQLHKLEMKKKEAMADFTAQLKELKEDRLITMGNVRTGVEEVTEVVYLMDDQETREMGYYNGNGHLVYSRPLMQDERQMRIVGNEKTGTNN